MGPALWGFCDEERKLCRTSGICLAVFDIYYSRLAHPNTQKRHAPYSDSHCLFQGDIETQKYLQNVVRETWTCDCYPSNVFKQFILGYSFYRCTMIPLFHESSPDFRPPSLGRHRHHIPDTPSTGLRSPHCTIEWRFLCRWSNTRNFFGKWLHGVEAKRLDGAWWFSLKSPKRSVVFFCFV